MSAAGLNLPGHERRPLDRYETPEWATRALMAAVRPFSGPIFDPGCGAGAISGVLYRSGLPVIGGIDIDPEAVADARRAMPLLDWDEGDFLAAGLPLLGACVGNPPYSLAEGFVRRGLQAVRPGGDVIYLLRLGFLAGQKRAHLYGSGSGFRAVYVLGRRPSFCHGGTDSADYGWIRWTRGYTGSATIQRLGTP